MDWRYKAAAFRVIDGLPGGTVLHYFLQRHVTRSVPRPLSGYSQYLEESRAIAEVLRDGIDMSDHHYFEFGAGWDLFHNLVLYSYGMQRQFLMDLTAHMRPELVNHVIRNLQASPPPGAHRVPERLLTASPVEELSTHYGITYHAPSDASRVPLMGGAISLSSTVNTMEHIPFDALSAILRELRRICAPSARLAMQIDYSDHYSHADRSISPYNFLQFSDSHWQRHNTRSHYQSRRRHPDYRELFLSSGFRIISERVRRPDDWHRALAGIALHPEFQAYDQADVAITSAMFSLEPACH